MVKIEDLENLEAVLDSPYGNTYGGLSMVVDKNKRSYLVMGDCCGDSYYGPLDDEQIKAFALLAKIEETNVDYTRGT